MLPWPCWRPEILCSELNRRKRAKELSWWDARWKKGDQRAVQRRHDHARTCRTGVGGQMSVKGKHEAAKPPDKAQEDTAPPAACSLQV